MNRRRALDAEPFAANPHRKQHLPGVNPYRDAHLAYGTELVPAESAPDWKGRWHALYGRKAPFCLELGVGNGNWLVEAAAREPEKDWLGMEIRYKRCVLCADKARKRGVANARVVRYSWFGLADLFEAESLDAVYIHHPDPWARGNEAKHRLIEPGMMGLVAQLIRPGGELRLKTDFRPHFDALLGSALDARFRVVGTSLDIRNLGAPWPDDIVTGYQSKFDREGLPVYAVRLERLAAAFPPPANTPRSV